MWEFLALLGVVVGAALTYYNQLKYHSDVQRRGIYKRFLRYLDALYESRQNTPDNEARKQRLCEAARACYLYATDETVRKINDLLQAVMTGRPGRDELARQVILSMRREIITGTALNSQDIELYDATKTQPRRT